MRLKSVKEADITGRTVLLRVDYNVCFTKDGKVKDATRITQTLPTINFLRSKNAKVVLISHLGRPKGRKDTKYSLVKIIDCLKKHLEVKNIPLIQDYWTKNSLKKTAKYKSFPIILLENTRFHPGEITNDKNLAKILSAYGDVFVYDAFGTAHRAHASTVGLSNYLPTYAGLLLEKEIKLINKIISKDNKKLCVIIGGAKTPEKIRVIDKLLERTFSILLGGAVANTFLSTWGISTGVSKVDYEMIEMARQIIWKATQTNSSLLLPIDVVVSSPNMRRTPKIISYENIPGHLAIFDIGPETIQKYKQKIETSDKIIWNGPLGFYEDKRFRRGTEKIFSLLAKHKGLTLIGGGDTISAVSKSKKNLNKITHISTGGGALLEYIEKGTLPGIEIVKK